MAALKVPIGDWASNTIRGGCLDDNSGTPNPAVS